ncbi:MAG: RNA-guided endonuclease TnpB family protein [Steroidobacteraceae bacterium]
MASPVFLTYRYRVKDATAGKWLDRMAVSVNQVWNYCGGIQNDSRRLNRRWPSFPELARLTAGSSKELGLHSDTVQDVLKHWVKARDKARHKPRWRVSLGRKRSLGWVPFQCDRPLKISGDTVTFLGREYRLWLSRPIPSDIRSGSFSQDATGRWFINLVCCVAADRPTGAGEVGIDFGLKTLAALSTGEMIGNPRHSRKSAAKLARAQRAGRKALARKIHRKVAAQRRHFLHVTTTRIARENALVCVGDVNSSALARTKMAKSVLDAGWSAFRLMLQYKMAMTPGALFVETNERMTTQVCSACGVRGGPKGLKDLGVRSWVCDGCGVLHERDTNAARNILRSGRNIALQLSEIPTL